MWYEVQKLEQIGLNKSQISRQTNLDRSTVRKYLLMDESEFHIWIKASRNLPLKLSKYMPFVKEQLQAFTDLSSAQIEDRLKEHFTDLPKFHSKTVYNFVQLVRKKYDIPKPKKKDSRIFEQLPETPYGQQAQVDFGETYMQRDNGKRKKVYFFAIVLSRSRFKYIYFENKPFTSASSILGHEQAFEYFRGIPKNIIYDQDSVFIHDENLGDYLLTEKFKSYCKTQSFNEIFCRKSDPQSKGKVENVVKYVKQNFLRGRKYKNIETLNNQAIAWLERTANQKKHESTQKIPREEFEEEHKYLLPIKMGIKKKQIIKKKHKVRKDNTIVYKSNFYSLPSGTYKNQETSVLLEVKDDKLHIYSIDNDQIATHSISVNKGEYIRNTDHCREKSKTIENMQKEVSEILGKTEIAKIFLDLLHKNKPRYFRDNLQYIIKNKKDYIQEIIDQSLDLCINNKQLNSKVLLEIIKNKHVEELKKEGTKIVLANLSTTKKNENVSDFKIKKSDINQYEKYFDQCN